MAKLYSMIFVSGLAGIADELNIQTRSGSTISAGKALFDDNWGYIDLLQPGQAAVLEATTYANFAKTQDVYLNQEQETGIPAYNLALADWFGLPKVLEINVDRWTGKSGQCIRVKARDNVKVARVTVMIRNAEGTLLERGEAVQSEAGSAWWNYTTKSLVPMTPFPTVKAIVQDLPGNTASFTIS